MESKKNAATAFKLERNPHLPKDMRDEVVSALSKLGLCELRRPKPPESEPLDQRTSDYIYRTRDPDDQRLEDLRHLTYKARALARTSRQFLDQSTHEVDNNLNTLQTFTHAPRGWFRELLAKQEVVVKLTPTFPPNDQCEEVRSAASHTLHVELCVDERHKPPQLIVREILEKDWAKEDRVPECEAGAASVTTAQTACYHCSSTDTQQTFPTSFKASAACGHSPSNKSVAKSQQGCSAVSSSICSAAFSTDLVVSSTCVSNLSHISPSYVSLQVDPMNFTLETRDKDESQNATSVSCHCICQCTTQHDQADAVPQEESSIRSPDPAMTYACQQHIISKDVQIDRQEMTHKTKERRRQSRDMRIVKESKEALVPEFSEKRVMIRGHYEQPAIDAEVPFLMFLYREPYQQDETTLCGSYVRGMVTAEKHLRWRFYHTITAVK